VKFTTTGCYFARERKHFFFSFHHPKLDFGSIDNLFRFQFCSLSLQ
jgi:hypothetical protein